jgi:hypothetical protein
MRQFKPLVGATVAVLALAVTASALARVTPEISVITGFTDRSGTAEFQGLGTDSIFRDISCSSTTSRGAFYSSLLATFDLLFKQCLTSSLGLLFLCTGLEDTETSSILMLGTLHLRYRSGTSGPAVVALLIKPIHITCVNGTTTSLLQVRNCGVFGLGRTNVIIRLPADFTLTMRKSQSSETLDEITKIENDAGTGQETCELEASEGTNAFSSDAMELTDELFPSSSEVEIRA